MTTKDRQRGCLLGLAVGDALGAAVEFQMPGTFEPVTDYRSGGPPGRALVRKFGRRVDGRHQHGAGTG